MIKIEDIYSATNDGLDIILHYYPQAKDCINANKSFKIRDENTASSRIKKYGNVWRVTDFGDDGHAMSPVDIVMKEENVRFTEAVLILADRYNVTQELNKTLNKPDIRQRAATEEEPEGHFSFEIKEKFTESELLLLGPKVNQEHVDALSYKSLAWYSKTKKNEKGMLETTVIGSNDNYPIFIRDCGDFKKVYQPLNPDKAFRFFYVGSKPKDFVNGLAELKKSYTRYNERERRDFESKPGNEEKSYIDKKLEAAVICSGERDAINCKSFGYDPLWLNSESAVLDDKSYREVMKLVDVLYNIPDIDSTGIRKGNELAFRYIDIRTVRLPEWLSTYKDMRGKPRKDLRDYIELRATKYDFESLLKVAKPLKFWEYIFTKDGKRLEINTIYLLNFLATSGFGKLQDPITKKDTLVKVEGFIVKEVTSKDVRSYLIKYLSDRLEDLEIVNLVLNSRRTSTVTMDDLPKLELDFKDHSESGQYMFFKNKVIEVTADKIQEYRNADSKRYIWESKISEHDFKRLAPSFKIEESDGVYNIEINSYASHYFCYLINSSRVYWREELEKRITGNEDEDKKYAEENKFNITGKRLNPLEIQEQEQNLVNKIFTIGYLLHRKKEMTKTWAVWVMEDKVSDDGISSGGSGKSFMVKFLNNFKSIITLGGRNKKLTENQHVFENVTLFTDMILVDDADQYIDFNFFYDKITGDLEVNEKHVKSRPIRYEESPKIVFTSNFPPRGNDPSTSRRLLFTVFSDYYHEKTEDNDYKETRRIYDDFNLQLGNNTYKSEYWNEDINFLIDCLQFYLRCSEEIKIQPPMEKVYDRMNIQIMGNQFRDWAEVYFSKDSQNCNKRLIKTDVFQEFIRESNVKGWTSQKFTKALRAFSQQADWIECLNPAEICNDRKRIIQTIDQKTYEMIYIKTVGSEINSDSIPF